MSSNHILQLIEAHADVTPDATAVECEGRALNYGELVHQARRIASGLHASGVLPGEIIGVSLDRSERLLPVLLGVWYAGATYLPLDSEQPERRLRFMIEDAGLSHILADKPHLDRIRRASGSSCHLINPDGLQSAQNCEVAPQRLAGSSAAYVLYTSGSTGLPKGVRIPHRALHNFILSMAQEPGISRVDIVLAITTLSFDISGLELFLPISTGAKVVIVPDGISREPGLLARKIQDSGATILQATPSTWRMLLDFGWTAPRPMKLLSGGEAMTPALLSRLLPQADSLWNMYGPTETTIWSSIKRLENATDPITIGRPIRNTGLHVLDVQRRELGPGEEGEIHISGSGLALGYLNRPDLDSERFLRVSLGSGGFRDLYATGDWGRVRADGEVEYLGRIDHQLKIRGHRIEAGEIEAALESHPKVGTAIVSSYEDANGDKTLVAYHTSPVGARFRRDEVARKQWAFIWDNAYGSPASAEDRNTSDLIAGWTRTATGEPIPPDEMSEWRRESVKAILKAVPGSPEAASILEIGFGTGMILRTLAPRVARYVGYEISENAANLVKRDVESGRLTGNSIEIRNGDALLACETGELFDLIILNSVVQYFPSAHYLEEVIQKAKARLRPGGRIFLGDLRNARLLRHFHRSILLAKGATAADARSLCEDRALSDPELCIDPRFFFSRAPAMHGLATVRIQTRSGIFRNEMNAYRFNVTLEGEAGSRPGSLPVHLKWNQTATPIHGLESHLSDPSSQALIVTGIPNDHLSERPGHDSALTDIIRIAEKWGRSTVVGPAIDGDPESLRMEIRSTDPAPDQPIPPIDLNLPERVAELVHEPALVSRPAHAEAKELRAFLSNLLPASMIPSWFVPLESFPISPNGKIDRKQLPPPVPEAATEEDSLVGGSDSAAGELTSLLRRIWRDTIGRPVPSDSVDFISFGGHSLQAARIVARVHAEIPGAALTIREFFEHPSIQALSDLLRRKRNASDRPASVSLTGTPSPAASAEEGSLPLTSNQERLRFLAELDPGSPDFNIPVLLKMEGNVDPDLLEAAVSTVIDRHESLRCTFPEAEPGDAGWRQKVRSKGRHGFQLARVELHGTDEAISVRIRTDCGVPFSIETQLPVRATLYSHGAGKWTLAITVHHLVIDGWSLSILLSELSAVYGSLEAGRQPTFPAKSTGLSSVISRRFEIESSANIAGRIAEIRRRLEGISMDGPAVALPFDFPRANGTSRFESDQFPLVLPESLQKGVRDLGLRWSATPTMVLLAALGALLHRLSGADKILIGTPVANRGAPELESTIAFLVSTVPIVFDFHGDPGFGECIRRARSALIETLDDADIPFSRLVEELAPPRIPGQNPVFQILFAVDDIPYDGLNSEKVRTTEVLELHAHDSTFDLIFRFKEGGNGSVTFRKDLFDSQSIRNLIDMLSRLLSEAIAAPDLPVSQLELIDDEEYRRILESGKGPAIPLPSGETMVSLFRSCARSRGTLPAVSDLSQTLSYEELDRQSDTLAAFLLGRFPPAKRSRIGICMRRNVRMVSSLLGVLKAGAAYVPIDPDAPDLRRKRLLEISGCHIILTESVLADRFDDDRTVVCMDRDWREIAAAVITGGSGAEPAPSDAAYIIFTSGSTGVPKGVEVTHEAVVNLTTAMAHAFPLERDGMQAEIAVNAPLYFDVSVGQLTYLLQGDHLHIIPEDVRLDPEAFKSLLSRNRIHVFDCTPSHLELLLQGGLLDSRAALELQFVLVAGEAVPPALWERLARSGTPFINAYGPTECTVYATWTPITDAANKPHIGTALGNLVALILDSRGKIVPRGVEGELWLGGPGLARGYLADEVRTAEKFRTISFRDGTRMRLYGTGDRARLRPDGNLDFLGRLDRQIKLRGHRIEPGEIEASALEVPGVARALAVPRQVPAIGPSLILYIQPARTAVTINALQEEVAQHLQASIAASAIPSFILIMDQIPLNPNGKLDLDALPLPTGSNGLRALSAPPRPIRGDTERKLAEWFQELLQTDSIDSSAHFFQLGGHSLLGAQLISRIRRSFGIHIPISTLYRTPVIADLARFIDEQPKSSGSRNEFDPPLVSSPHSSESEIPLMQRQAQRLLLERTRPETLSPVVAFAYHLRGRIDPDALERAAKVVISRHHSLRMEFDIPNDRARCVNSTPGFRLERYLATDADEAEKLLAPWQVARFDLEKAPLLRMQWARWSETDSFLAIQADHIVFDGESRQIFFDELSAAYRMETIGEASTLPALELSAIDFAHWQRRILHGPQGDPLRSFWRTKLASHPGILPMRSMVTGGRPSRIPRYVSSDVGDSPLKIAKKLGTSPFSVILWAYATILARETGTESVVIVSPASGRALPGLELVIGYFNNILPFVCRLLRDKSFGQQIHAVKDDIAACLEHENLPIDLIQATALHAATPDGYAPLFQFMLNIEDEHSGSRKWRDIEATPLPQIKDSRLKVDLQLIFRSSASPQGPRHAFVLAFDQGLFDQVFAEKFLKDLNQLFAECLREVQSS